MTFEIATAPSFRHKSQSQVSIAVPNTGDDENQNLSVCSLSFGSKTRTVEQIALSNNLILWLIFECLDIQDLLVCRRVNLIWNHEATSVLLARPKVPPLPIPLVLNISTKNNYQNRLNEFVDLLKSSGRFPYNNFSIISTSNLIRHDCLREFFSIHGNNIKKLKIEWTAGNGNNEEVTPSMFETLILKQCSNLESLTLVKMPNSAMKDGAEMFVNRKSNQKQGNNVQLQKLSGLNLLCSNISKNFLNSFLTLSVSANLKMVKCTQSNLVTVVEVLLQLNRIKLLKRMTLDFDSENFEQLHKISNLNLKLEKLRITNFDFGYYQPFHESAEETARILNRLLEATSDTLKVLKSIPLGFLGDHGLNEMPTLSQLTRFEVNYPSLYYFYHNGDSEDENDRYRIFPPKMCFKEVFPNLTQLKIFGNSESNIFSKDPTLILFGDQDLIPVLSVQEIFLYGNCDDINDSGGRNPETNSTWFEYVSRAFPCTTKLICRPLF